jgi:excisionase family DNA binding protein
MHMYNATVEVETKASKLAEARVDVLMGKLANYHGALGTSARGWLAYTISLPAESLEQACSTALAVITQLGSGTPVACEVMTEREFNAREGFEDLPDLVSASEAAEILGVTRQAVQQMHQAGKLGGTKIGTSLAFPRSNVERAAALRNQGI